MSDRAQTHQNLIYAQDVDKNVQSNHIECLVPNFPLQNCLGAKLFAFTMLVPNCQGAKLSAFNSWCQIVLCQFSGCQIVRFQLLVPNCPLPILWVPNCPLLTLGAKFSSAKFCGCIVLQFCGCIVLQSIIISTVLEVMIAVVVAMIAMEA